MQHPRRKRSSRNENRIPDRRQIADRGRARKGASTPLDRAGAKLARTSRSSRRGYSLLEVLVVLAIIALITSATALALFKFIPEAKIKTTIQSAHALRTAVGSYRLEHDDCPTMEILTKNNLVDQATSTTDAWDQPFVIECEDNGNTHIASGGPDKRLGNADDIRVPGPPAKAAAVR